MKKLVITLMAALCAAVTGCKTLPTPESMEATSKTVGVAAGLVVNQNKKIDEKSKNTIIDIVTLAKDVTPGSNETFVVVWTPVASNYLNQVKAKNNLTDDQCQAIMTGFNTVCSGFDYFIEVRFPEAKNHIEVIQAGIRGFSSGFLSVCKKTDGSLSASREDLAQTYDVDVYNYMKSQMK